jgi:hypothetical protein
MIELVTIQVERFANKEALDRYIKNHVPVGYDDKTELLNTGKLDLSKHDEDTSIKFEIRETSNGRAANHNKANVQNERRS